jgi:23S rRNA (uracil1939-C5)-methyltransferase
MRTISLALTGMAHGGAALGRDEEDRVIFVPLAIEGEEVRVELVSEKPRYAHARLLEVLASAPSRVEPRCPHFGPCGGCHYQHIDYQAQLGFKMDVVQDQLQRLAQLANVDVRPALANPEPWAYATSVSFSPAPGGRLGFWSPELGRVMAIDTCHIIRPDLLELYQDLDVILPGLRQITLRSGDDGAQLAAIETDGAEPPALEADFPVSAALVLADGTAANLIGDNYIVQRLLDRDFRVTAGVYFYPSPPAAELLVEAVLEFAGLRGGETVLELYSGAGALTAFVAPRAAALVAVEANADAVADAVVNLEDLDNISLYQGTVESVVPMLDLAPDLLLLDPPAAGLSTRAIDSIINKAAPAIIYVGSDVATLARDARRLAAAGYTLATVQPIDMYPQTYQTLSVAHFRRVETQAEQEK